MTANAEVLACLLELDDEPMTPEMPDAAREAACRRVVQSLQRRLSEGWQARAMVHLDFVPEHGA